LGKARFWVKKLTEYTRSEFKIKTKTAVVGVRGSDFIIKSTPKLTEVTALKDTLLEIVSLADVEAKPTILADYERSIIELDALPTEAIKISPEEIEEMIMEMGLEMERAEPLVRIEVEKEAKPAAGAETPAAEEVSKEEETPAAEETAVKTEAVETGETAEQPTGAAEPLRPAEDVSGAAVGETAEIGASEAVGADIGAEQAGGVIEFVPEEDLDVEPAEMLDDVAAEVTELPVDIVRDDIAQQEEIVKEQQEEITEEKHEEVVEEQDMISLPNPPNLSQ
jgi:hypothetical protein